MSKNNDQSIIVLTLPRVTNFRKVYESKDGTGAMYGATCSILDIFAARNEIDAVTDINPRTQKQTSTPSKAMRETLKDAQDMFVFRNRGMTFIAYDATWDNKTNELTLTFKLEPTSDTETNGLADGAHTYEVIKNFVADTEEAERGDITAEVRLDILTGFEGKTDEVVSIVESRNTSTQVKDESLLNFQGVFNPLKDAVTGASYAENIAYYENERVDEKDPTSNFRSVKVSTVLSYLMCFDPVVFSENEHPVKAYSSKKKAVEWYEAKWEGKNGGRDELLALMALAKEVLDLRDYIEAKIPKVWNKISGRFVDQKGVRKLKEDKSLDFSQYSVDYDVPGGYVYPILAAFRSLVIKDGNVYRFKTDPKKLFDRMNEQTGKSLVYKLKGTLDQDPQALGKNPDLYGTCYASLLAYFYEQASK